MIGREGEITPAEAGPYILKVRTYVVTYLHMHSVGMDPYSLTYAPTYISPVTTGLVDRYDLINVTFTFF